MSSQLSAHTEYHIHCFIGWCRSQCVVTPPRWPAVCGAGHCDQVVRLQHLYYNFSNTGHCRRHRCRRCKLHVAMEPGAAGAWAGTRDICLDCAQLTPLKLTTAATTHIISCAVFCSCSIPYKPCLTLSHVQDCDCSYILIDTTSYDLCTLMLLSLPIHLVDFKFIWNNILYPENCWSYYYCICMSHIKQSYLKWNCSTSNEYAAAAASLLTAPVHGSDAAGALCSPACRAPSDIADMLWLNLDIW